MYENHFCFNHRPFLAIPDARSYFPSESMETARKTVIQTLECGTGIALVFGKNGYGKSLLLKMLELHLENDFRVISISNPRLRSPKTLYQHILFSLHQSFCGIDENELRLLFYDYLRQEEPSGIVLLIDEAQTVPRTILEEVRILQQYNNGESPIIRVALAGTPAFEERLTHHYLTAFQQQVVARCYLENFSREETAKEIAHQLKKAGCSNPQTLFSKEAQRFVYDLTDGVPRVVHQLCDQSLTFAANANLQTVDETTIQAAWENLQQLADKNVSITHFSAKKESETFVQNSKEISKENSLPQSTVEFGVLDDIDNLEKSELEKIETNEIINNEENIDDNVNDNNKEESHAKIETTEIPHENLSDENSSPEENFDLPESSLIETDTAFSSWITASDLKEYRTEKYPFSDNKTIAQKLSEPKTMTLPKPILDKNEPCQKCLDEMTMLEQLVTQEFSVINKLKKMEKDCHIRRTNQSAPSSSLASFPELINFGNKLKNKNNF